MEFAKKGMRVELNRRKFMAGATAMSLVPSVGRAATAPPTLEAKPGRVRLITAEFGDYPETEIWGFGGGVPGPMIRARQGDVLQRRLVNNLPQPTSVHWHGLRVPNAMDGVPGMTQDAVAQGGEFLYELPLKDAGTYWYHSHNQSTEQVARGLYGVLIVDEEQPPEVDHDVTIVLDDWRLSKKAQITDDFGAMHDWTHAGRMGNYIHAHLAPQISTVEQNQRLRLRFVNVATDRIMSVSLNGVAGKIVARDGMPLETLETPEVMVFGPAERADLIVDVTAAVGETVQLVIHERDTGYLLEEIEVTGQHAKTPRGPVPRLPGNPIERLTDLKAARSVPLNMEGGAMGGLRQGKYKGRVMSPQELVREGQIWTFNGEVGLPEAPLITAQRGETIRIPMQNNTVFPHAMHLHGTHFQEVLPDGTFGPLKDTILMDARETREIAFVADNPGDWLLHCHMLSHQAAGMKTWLRVT
ncbi:multicopper oxidase family protein [Alisedimentitalea sp. MJ-SS2]|uniref:multicopper oxidase family protein n=1 Tax=Aliisedimentitalea sp. MJ-SS2 TaxID=3049795 RepID=UPI00290C3B0F|nr:multicopper oxidase family protein [Alisedimentitalea sp. MJ-SS2]MDU8929833.1 multicopper oxidase family protein [Alisedimentitalea sp. MJ-SS2]